jgi:hypothetical protein
LWIVLDFHRHLGADLEGRPPDTRCALLSCIAAHLEARGKATKSQESLLYFQPLDRTGRRALAGIGPSDADREFAGDPTRHPRHHPPLMLKSMSTADLPTKRGGGPGRHARRVKSLSDRDACVSHPADCGNCEQ